MQRRSPLRFGGEVLGAGDHHRDVEAAVGLAAGGYGRVMRGEDRPGDGQAEPDAVASAGPGLYAPERLEELWNSVVWDDRAAVGDLEVDGGIAAAGAQPDPASGLVVPDGVADQVADHPLQQLRVAGRLGRVELRIHAEAQAFDVGGGRVERVLGTGGQVGELDAAHALIADGEGEQRLDHALGPVDRVPHAHG